MVIKAILSRLYIERYCKRFLHQILELKSLGFTSKPIVTNFHIPSCILNTADRRNKLKIKNSDKKTLNNPKSRTKSLYIKLDMAPKNLIC